MFSNEVFVDREKELEILENSYLRRPGYIVVYGRRRIGKTRLILEFLKKHRGIYYLARLTSHEDNLSNLCRAVEGIVPGFCGGKQYSSIDTLLSDIARENIDVVVIDEFTYWVKIAPRVVSELQVFIDSILPKTKLLLILSGSLVGVIEKSVLGSGSPLYGRRTAHIKLDQLKPWHTKEFLNNLRSDERALVYASVGGVPYYLLLFSRYNNLEEAYRRLVFNKQGILYHEPDFLLHEEFKNPSVYSRILKAISNGYNRLGKISEYTGIPKTHLPVYLEKLERIGFIKHAKPLWSKKGYYIIRDYFLNFYYYVVDKVRELIELELEEEAWATAQKLLREYMGRVFEHIVYDLVPLLYRKNLIPRPLIIGKYIHRGIDIDLVVIDQDKREACLIEAKWSIIDDQYAKEILASLKKKQEKIRKLEDYRIRYLIISRKNQAEKYRDIIVDIDMLGV